MAKQIPATLERVGSHSVRATQGGDTIDKEECYGYFRAEWQGKPVAVTMEANRYAYASIDRSEARTWSEWRVFANDAHYIDDAANGGRGAPTTPTARTRLAEACRPAMLAWLESADYAASRRVAFAHVVRGMLRELRPWDDPTRRVRAFMERCYSELDASTMIHLAAACNAYDEFARIFNGSDD